MCDFVQEPLKKGLTVGGVGYFGMVLDAINSACCVFYERCWGVGGGGSDNESGWGFSDGVEVRHPYDVACGDLRWQQLGRLASRGKFGPAIFSASASVNGST